MIRSIDELIYLNNGEDSEDLKGILQRQYLGICESNNISTMVTFLSLDEYYFITGSAIAIDSGRLSS